MTCEVRGPASLLIAAVTLVAVLGLWSIGPSLPLGALLVVIPLLATFFFGKRVGIAGGAAMAVLLAGIFVASRLAGRSMVGAIPGARVPYSVYVELAVMTLALNARDAMPAGGVITIRLAHRLGAAEDRACVEVEDTGNGMDPATASRMFEPFFTTKPAGAGTGLGLAIVQQFVSESGGAIEVDSAVGRGTRVRLTFPTPPAHQEVAATAATS